MSDNCSICGVPAKWGWWARIGKDRKSVHLCTDCAWGNNNDVCNKASYTSSSKRKVIQKIKQYGKTKKCEKYCG